MLYNIIEENKCQTPEKHKSNNPNALQTITVDEQLHNSKINGSNMHKQVPNSKETPKRREKYVRMKETHEEQVRGEKICEVNMQFLAFLFLFRGVWDCLVKTTIFFFLFCL